MEKSSLSYSLISMLCKNQLFGNCDASHLFRFSKYILCNLAFYLNPASNHCSTAHNVKDLSPSLYYTLTYVVLLILSDSEKIASTFLICSGPFFKKNYMCPQIHSDIHAVGGRVHKRTLYFLHFDFLLRNTFLAGCVCVKVPISTIVTHLSIY